MYYADDTVSTAQFLDLAIEKIAGFDVSRGRSSIRVLDFGTGSGRIAKELTTKGYDVYGCDIIAPPVDIDPTHSRQITFNPYRIPYDDDSFDIIISTSVLEHAQNPHEYFPEMFRVLKPGGVSMHILPGKWYLPSEPHIFVPLANFFYPNCPTWWFAMWTLLGQRGPGERGMTWREATQAYRNYYDNGLFYISSGSYEKFSLEIFGNFEWPMEFYMKHAEGGFTRLFRNFPFQKFWGKFSKECRMGFLVQRKPTPIG